MTEALLVLFVIHATWLSESSGIPEEARIQEHMEIQIDPTSDSRAQGRYVWNGDGPILASSWLGVREKLGLFPYALVAVSSCR